MLSRNRFVASILNSSVRTREFVIAKCIPSFLLKISPLSLTFVAIFSMVVHTFLLPIFVSWVASLALFISSETSLFKEISQHFKVHCADVPPTAGSTYEQEWEDPTAEFSDNDFEKLLEIESMVNPTDILNACDLFDKIGGGVEDFYVFEQDCPRTARVIREHSEELIKLIGSAPAEREEGPFSFLSGVLNMPEDMIIEEYIRLSDQALLEATSRDKSLGSAYDRRLSHEDLIYKVAFANAQDTGNFEGVSMSAPSMWKSPQWSQYAALKEQNRDFHIRMFHELNKTITREPFTADLSNATMSTISDSEPPSAPEPKDDSNGFGKYLPSWSTVKSALKTTALVCLGGVVVYFVGKEVYTVAKEGLVQISKTVQEK